MGLPVSVRCYDLVDCTGPVFEIKCGQGGELFPKGYTSMQVFRDADDLIFVHNKRNIYGGGEKTVAIGLRQQCGFTGCAAACVLKRVCPAAG